MNKYFNFLCDLVGGMGEHYMLLKRLQHFEFYSLVPHDDNRIIDGQKLREIFLDEEGYMASSYLPNGPCTVFELIIGMAIRMENDLAEGKNEKTVSECFWELIKNIRLDWADDTRYTTLSDEQEVDTQIQTFLDRRYDFDGHGGLFPLKYTKKDQRQVELWYQMAEYLLENYEFV